MLFAHKIKYKKLAIVLIGSGLLAACNQAGNSSSTPANALQHAAVKSAKESQKVLQIVNHSSSVIDHINILNESGQVLFKSTAGLNCINNQNCNVDINGLITTDTMIAKLYNAKNQLVSMVKLKDNSQKLKYTIVYANDTIFGTQLFKNLIVAENLSRETVVEQLTKFFNNGDYKISIFTELGAYYSEQLAKGRIHNETEFYKLLINDMKHGKAISGKKLLARAYVPELQTSLMGCDNELGNKIFDTISPIGKIIGKEAISGIAEEGKAIFNWACPAETVDFKAEFDKINEKLDMIQSSIDALGGDVKALRKLIIAERINTDAIYMDTLSDNEDVFNSNYQAFLKGVNESSLVAYLAANEGIDKVEKEARGSNTNALFGLDGLFTTINDQNKNIRKLTSDNLVKELTQTMIAKCGSVSNITNDNGDPADIFKETNLCILQTTNMGYYLAMASQLSRLRMLDIVNAINTAKNPHLSFANGFGPNGTAVLWKDVPDIINKDNEKRVINAGKFIVDSIVFIPSKDLYDMNIKLTIDADCGISKFEKTKVFPSNMKYNDKDYDSITVTMACNGKKPSTRALLPGGVYHIDTSNNGNPNTRIAMDNARDWEVNEKINPLIAPSAAVVSDSYVSISGRAEVYDNFKGWSVPYKVGCPGYFDDINKYLESQGRDLRLNSCTTTDYKENGWTKYADAHYEVKDKMRTKLYIPLMINYDGYKTVAIWRDSNGLRADYYGQADSSKWVRLLVGKDYGTGENEFMNVQGYRKFKNTVDNNVINIGPNT